MEAWAVVEHEKPLEKIQREIPDPTGTEVLVKVSHCGVCHSDLHFWEGWYELGGGKKMRMADRGVKLPRAIGHEILGTVAKLGPDAQGVEVGSRQIVFPWLGCGTCRRCLQGDDQLCAKNHPLGVAHDGGFAQYVIAPHPRHLVDPGNVDPNVACTFACSGLTVFSSIQKIMPLEPEDPVLLVGAGGLGLSAIAMLKALGHKHIISADISAEKRAEALKAGATVALDSTAPDAIEQIKNAAGAPILGTIDFVNNSQTAALAYNVVAKGAKLVGVGIMGGEMHLSNVELIFKSVTIMGNYVGNPGHLRSVVKLAQEGKLLPIPTEKVPWDEANEALVRLREGKVTGRLVLNLP